MIAAQRHSFVSEPEEFCFRMTIDDTACGIKYFVSSSFSEGFKPSLCKWSQLLHSEVLRHDLYSKLEYKATYDCDDYAPQESFRVSFPGLVTHCEQTQIVTPKKSQTFACVWRQQSQIWVSCDRVSLVLCTLSGPCRASPLPMNSSKRRAMRSRTAEKPQCVLPDTPAGTGR